MIYKKNMRTFKKKEAKLKKNSQITRDTVIHNKNLTTLRCYNNSEVEVKKLKFKIPQGKAPSLIG